MDQMKRFAIYYAPEPGAFADAAAAWLGWDLAAGKPVAQPAPDLPYPLSQITATPRKYGFHATLKPPFRLADGTSAADLAQATAQLAARFAPLELPGLQMMVLDGFLASEQSAQPITDHFALTGIGSGSHALFECFCHGVGNGDA